MTVNPERGNKEVSPTIVLLPSGRVSRPQHSRGNSDGVLSFCQVEKIGLGVQRGQCGHPDPYKKRKKGKYLKQFNIHSK